MELALIFDTLQERFPFFLEHKYTLLFVAGCLEGFSALILAGFLLAVGKLSFWPTFLALASAEMINGYIWYTVGYVGGSRPIDWIVRKSDKQRMLVEQVRKYLQSYTAYAILIAKMTFSITVITQILVGTIRYPFRKFTLYNFVGSVGWVAMVLTIGYFFGEGYRAIFQYWRNASHLIAFAVLVLVGILMVRRLFNHVFLWVVRWLEKVGKFSKSIEESIEKFISEGEQK